MPEGEGGGLEISIKLKEKGYFQMKFNFIIKERLYSNLQYCDPYSQHSDNNLNVAYNNKTIRKIQE